MITFSALGTYGRLGNQLFQIAAVIGTSTKTGNSSIFPENATIYNNTYNFGLPGLPSFEMSKIQWQTRAETTFTFDESVQANIKPDDNIDLSGYFQSEKYFVHCKELIKSTFINENTFTIREKLKKEFKLDLCNKTCAVHIRRGDYINLSQHYTQLDQSYYMEAIKSLTNDITNIIVFSDDIEWCKQTITGSDVVYSENKQPIEDLLLMSACNYHIIANSSFSWWGSWLANSKITIAPKLWFGPLLPLNTKDLYRADMVLL